MTLTRARRTRQACGPALRSQTTRIDGTDDLSTIDEAFSDAPTASPCLGAYMSYPTHKGSVGLGKITGVTGWNSCHFGALVHTASRCSARVTHKKLWVSSLTVVVYSVYYM